MRIITTAVPVFRQYVIISLVFIIFTFGTKESKAQIKKNHFALLIGSPVVDIKKVTVPYHIDDVVRFYEDLSLPVEKDILAMKSWLQRSGYDSSDIVTLTDSTLSIKQVQLAINKAGAQLADSALFLLYFTGHGQQIPDQLPLDEKDNLDETLVLPQELWIDDDINKLLSGTLARFHNVFIIDACYAGSSFQIAGIPTMLKRQLEQGSRDFIDDYFTNIDIVGQPGCNPFLKQKEPRFKLIYYGAAGDLDQEKAEDDGSWLTKQLSLVSQKSFFSQFDYRQLACYLGNQAREVDLPFTPVYVEIGNVSSYNISLPLKPSP